MTDSVKVGREIQKARRDTFCDTVAFMTRLQMSMIRFCCHCTCSLNAKQHGAKSAVAKAIGGHSGHKSGMAMAIAAIPVAPPRSRNFHIIDRTLNH